MSIVVVLQHILRLSETICGYYSSSNQTNDSIDMNNNTIDYCHCK